MLNVGKVYTISACKRTGDRSYIGTLWRVVGQNETTAVVVSLEAQDKTDHYWHGKPHILDKCERVFTPADDLVDVVYPRIPS